MCFIIINYTCWSTEMKLNDVIHRTWTDTEFGRSTSTLWRCFSASFVFKFVNIVSDKTNRFESWRKLRGLSEKWGNERTQPKPLWILPYRGRWFIFKNNIKWFIRKYTCEFLPLQLFPSAFNLYPAQQLHSYDPGVFVHICSHPPECAWHSLISTGQKSSLIK